MDQVTSQVRDLYSRFPYPSREPGERRLTELARLLWLLTRETGYDLRGKSVLDIGTGTGHRLIAAARRHPETQFTAVDLCEPPLAIARLAAEDAGVTNVTFRQHDLMRDGAIAASDVVLCMGVLHHLADPAAGLRRVASHVAPGGLALLYVYGERGSHERMGRKEMVSLLSGGDASSLERRLATAKALRLAPPDFGWNLNADDAESGDALIVDSYINAHEVLFNADGLLALMRGSGFYGFMVFGVTSGSHGLLFDTACHGVTSAFAWTDMKAHLPSAELIEAYERLPLRDRYRLVELAYEPNGYTILAYTEAAAGLLEAAPRVQRNVFRL